MCVCAYIWNSSRHKIVVNLSLSLSLFDHKKSVWKTRFFKNEGCGFFVFSSQKFFV